MPWPVSRFVRSPYLNVERVFPLKQAAVEYVIGECKKRNDVTELVVFGSSTRASCNPWSDIDLYVVGANRFASPIVLSYGDECFDLWYSSDRDESPTAPLFEEIDRTGVIVYRR